MAGRRTIKDKYGFVVDERPQPEPQEGSILIQKTKNLSKMLTTVLKTNVSEWAEIAQMTTRDEILRHKHLKQLIREHGIPDDLRGKLWPVLSGSDYLQERSRVVYQDIITTLSQYKNDSSAQIEKDLFRSFPGHTYFDSEAGVQALRNVLTAFSWLNPVIGYTQSMNFWVGLILLFLGEEECFWVTVTVIEKVLPPQYYDETMIDIIVDNQMLFILMDEYLPRLHQHISSYTTDVSPILTHWFLCLFVNTLSTEITLRIIDCLMYEGNKILMRVALAIFKSYEAEILKTESMEDLFMLIAKPTKIQDVESFMSLMFDRIWLRGFGRSKLLLLRAQLKEDAVKRKMDEDARREARIASRKAPEHSKELARVVLPSTSKDTEVDIKRQTMIKEHMRALDVPEEALAVVDRRSWRMYKKSGSDNFEVIEDYFSTVGTLKPDPFENTTPTSPQNDRFSFMPSRTDTPKARKTQIGKPINSLIMQSSNTSQGSTPNLSSPVTSTSPPKNGCLSLTNQTMSNSTKEPPTTGDLAAVDLAFPAATNPNSVFLEPTPVVATNGSPPRRADDIPGSPTKTHKHSLSHSDGNIHNTLTSGNSNPHDIPSPRPTNITSSNSSNNSTTMPSTTARVARSVTSFMNTITSSLKPLTSSSNSSSSSTSSHIKSNSTSSDQGSRYSPMGGKRNQQATASAAASKARGKKTTVNTDASSSSQTTASAISHYKNKYGTSPIGQKSPIVGQVEATKLEASLSDTESPSSPKRR